MSKWISKTIGELCDESGGVVQTGPFGSQLHMSDYSEQGTPVVMPADILDGRISEAKVARVSDYHVNRLEKYQLKKGDIVYGRRGDIGRQALIRHESEGWLCGTGCLKISLGYNSDVDPSFLHLFLKSPRIIEWIYNQAIGATMPNLNTKILRSVPIRFPENKSEQLRLLAFVSNYNNLIETNNRRIQLLESMAEGIYKEWFVRLRFPGYQNFKTVKGVPEGWGLKKLGEVSEIKSSKRVFLKDYVPTGTPFYRSKEIIEKSAGKSTKTELFIKQEKFDELDHKFGSPSLGDILLTAVGTIGVSYLVTGEDKFYFKDGNLIWLQQKNLAHNQFLFMWLNTDFGKGKISEMTIGSSQAALTISGLKNVEILLPDEELIEQYINDFFEPMNKQKNLLLQEIQNLTQTRDKLLPRLISGKLSVENLDINFPPSMEEALV